MRQLSLFPPEITLQNGRIHGSLFKDAPVIVSNGVGVDSVALLIELHRLNIVPEYSFIDGRFAYLEEDCDYGRFVETCNAQNIPLPEIQDRYVERFDRNRPRFGDSQFSPEFWDKLRR